MDIGVVSKVLWLTISIVLTNWKVHESVVYLESLKYQCHGHQLISSCGVKMLSHFLTNNITQPLLEISNHLNTCLNTTQLYLCEMGPLEIALHQKNYLHVKHNVDRLAFAWAHESWNFEDWCNKIWSNKLSFEIGKNSKPIRMWDYIVPSFMSSHISMIVLGAFGGFVKCNLI